MYILGINSAYHEPSACLIKAGHIVAAVEEERFTRVRHGKPANLKNPHEIPANSIRYCLDVAGIRLRDVDHIGYSFRPEKRLAHNIGLGEEVTAGCADSQEREQLFFDLLQSVPEVLSSRFNDDIRDRFIWIEHHVCHASSTFYLSPIEQAAILSLDGIGEATCTWFGRGDGNRLAALRELIYPHSLGLLWTKMSRFLGFGEYGQWKVMGLAGYGNAARYYSALREFADFDGKGNFSIDPQVLQLRVNRFDRLEKLFGPDRSPGAPVEKRHEDVAAALQKLTTEVFLSFASYLHRETGLNHLCLAGGVALNCVANRALVEDGPFDGVFIQPAANDGGTALGACYYIWNQLLDQPRGQVLEHVFLGPEFSPSDGLAALAGEKYSNITAQNHGGIPARVARLLAQGEIVAWHQGRMEFGPRALGNRSILADPRRSDIIYTLNGKVKHREYFRPMAASVLTERADAWFVIDRPTPSDSFMVTARLVREEKRGIVPAVTHVDNTCRIQRVDRITNPRFHALLTEFEKLTGVPLILNTSFNDREPIICTPKNAVATCLKSGIRYLVLGNELIDFGAPDLSAESDAGTISNTLDLLGADPEVPVMRPFMSRGTKQSNSLKGG
jgi:carbamoyltransferase